MSHPDFKPFYEDGQRVMPGDRIMIAGPPERVITSVFDPDHEVSRYYEMENGCAEITPHSIASLPLDEDTILVARASDLPPANPPNDPSVVID